MGRLLYVILFTGDMDGMRAFYENGLGIAPREATFGWTAFGTRGATLALHAVQEGHPAEIKLAFEALDLESRIAMLHQRGVRLLSELVDSSESTKANLRDPEGNLIAIVQPKGVKPEGDGLALSHAIVNAEKFTTTVNFYRDLLGLRIAEESEHWVEFDTGRTRLAVHDRADRDGLPLHADQRVTFALMTEDLEAFADALPGRGVRLASAPTEELMGQLAEVEDPDGYIVVLRGPTPVKPLEEELAEEWEEEDTPHLAAIRKPPAPAEATMSRLVSKPAYKSPAAKKKAAERVATKALDKHLRERSEMRAAGEDRPGAKSEAPRPRKSASRAPAPARPPAASRTTGPVKSKTAGRARPQATSRTSTSPGRAAAKRGKRG